MLPTEAESETETGTEIQKQVLEYWFGDAAAEDAEGPRMSLWFRGTASLDEEIRARFGAIHAAAASGALARWAETAEGAVALVVILDQFSRHLYRGRAEMFAWDGAARQAAEAALRHGGLTAPREAAVLLCLMHTEDVALARQAAEGMGALWRAPRTRGHRKAYKRLRYSALKHLRVLERFGRYPHRNALLGRETTEEEARYLADDQSRYVRSVQSHPPIPASEGGAGAGRLKILVLHSFRQSAARLSARTGALRRALEDIAELIYVDAPHVYTPDPSERAMLEEDFGEVPDFSSQRCWWNAEGGQKEAYTGWEDALRSLDARLREVQPDGVLGFSQGGAVAGLLAALRTERLRFAICISGFPSRATAHDMLTRPDSIDLPSLHIYGEKDVLMDRSRTLALAACFRDAAVHSHPGGHFYPEQWPLEEIRRFLLRFVEVQPPPRQQLASPTWAEATRADHDAPEALPSLAELAALLPEGAAARGALLAEARGLRRVVRPRDNQDLLAPLPGDLAHRIWLATWQQDPEVVEAALEAEEDWRGLVRLSLCATALLADAGPLIARIAARFAGRIAQDEASPHPSRAAEFAPRPDSATNRTCGLGREIAALLEPGLAGEAAYIAYRRRVVALAARSRRLRQRRPLRHKGQEAPAPTPTAEVLRPRPVPVIPCPVEELSPLLAHLSANTAILADTEFARGMVTADGRLDLCKQVVGPSGIGPLLDALADNTRVERLLLGNNVVGAEGAAKITEVLRARRSHLKVWYIAGNELDARALAPICEALADAPHVEALWLKRNPLGPAAGAPLAALLRSSARLHTLDLVNTGLLDEGALEVIEALADNAALRHLYIGTNGLGPATGAALGRYLARVDRLESLYVSCNRLGDEGVAALAEGLAQSRRLVRLGLASNRIGPEGARALTAALARPHGLRFLDLGWTRATAAVGEGGNRLGDEGAAVLAAWLRQDQALRALDVSHSQITQAGLDHLGEALEGNHTLVSLRHPQHGKATNPDAIARLQGRLVRNRRRWGLDADALEALRSPQSARDVLSVYRMQPMS